MNTQGKAEDRFEKLADNYAALWNEVTAEIGIDYQEFQRSIFEASLSLSNLRTLSTIDLGVGDGETLWNFVNYECEKLTGIDLNPAMLEASAKRFGSKVHLVKGDIRKLEELHLGSCDLIVSGATIHNVPKKERVNVWAGIKSLTPLLFVLGDKIADPDPVLHREYYKKETQAIELVYRERHGLAEQADEWSQHYEVDEQERLELKELELAFADSYNIELVGEFGMLKTVKCTKQ